MSVDPRRQNLLASIPSGTSLCVIPKEFTFSDQVVMWMTYVGIPKGVASHNHEQARHRVVDALVFALGYCPELFHFAFLHAESLVALAVAPTAPRVFRWVNCPGRPLRGWQPPLPVPPEPQREHSQQDKAPSMLGVRATGCPFGGLFGREAKTKPPIFIGGPF